MCLGTGREQKKPFLPSNMLHPTGIMTLFKKKFSPKDATVYFLIMILHKSESSSTYFFYRHFLNLWISQAMPICGFPTNKLRVFITNVQSWNAFSERPVALSPVASRSLLCHFSSLRLVYLLYESP